MVVPTHGINCCETLLIDQILGFHRLESDGVWLVWFGCDSGVSDSLS